MTPLPSKGVRTHFFVGGKFVVCLFEDSSIFQEIQRISRRESAGSIGVGEKFGRVTSVKEREAESSRWMMMKKVIGKFTNTAAVGSITMCISSMTGLLCWAALAAACSYSPVDAFTAAAPKALVSSDAELLQQKIEFHYCTDLNLRFESLLNTCRHAHD